MKKTAKAIFTAFSSAMAALYFIICYYSVKMPDKWYNESGKNFKIDTFLPIQVENKSYDTESTFENNNNLSSDAEMKLFGVIPIKSININETGEKYLVPGGELYGLKIHIDGAVVTGMGNGESSSGNICPAEKGKEKMYECKKDSCSPAERGYAPEPGCLRRKGGPGRYSGNPVSRSGRRA